MQYPWDPFPESTDSLGLPCYVIPPGDFVVVKQHFNDKNELVMENYATPTAGMWHGDLKTADAYTEKAAFTLANMIGEGCMVCNKQELIKAKEESND